VFLVLEILFLSGFYFFPIFFKRQLHEKKYNISYLLFILDGLAIGASYLGLYYYKRGHLVLTDDYTIFLMGIYLAWIYVSISTHKFMVPGTKNYLRVIWPFAKSSLIILSILSFFIITFRIEEFSRLIVIGSILAFALSEFILVSIYHIYRKPVDSDEVEQDFFSAAVLSEPDEDAIEIKIEEHYKKGPKYQIPVSSKRSGILEDKLKNVYLKNNPGIYNFIDESLRLNIDIRHAEIISSGNPYNIEVLPDNDFHLLFNLHEINDFRRVNRYFIEVNKKLVNGGVFISRFIPLEKRRQHYLNRYPRNLANVLYLLDFIWRRIFPKIPFFQKIYFAVSKGRNRVLSKAEALGRLYFCGFEIVNIKEIDEYLYFIAKKTKEPSKDENPSYSPVFKMSRMGKNGKEIFIYKFRTMYPYSEYLQSYLVEINGYAENGKIDNDFRVTAWGKFMRKYWLDELPQVINLLKGEMNLVGIRPISRRFLKEFPEDIRELRKQYKPGCIPAYVSLLKQSKDGFIEAETNYLREKQKHPILTDIKYIGLATYNILTNKIRSA
ncbi:MAG TPA: sugar transferase, partial [Caldithrix sp.]|nr:sugar transferase [Caldithrix sp.]